MEPLKGAVPILETMPLKYYTEHGLGDKYKVNSTEYLWARSIVESRAIETSEGWVLPSISEVFSNDLIAGIESVRRALDVPG